MTNRVNAEVIERLISEMNKKGLKGSVQYGKKSIHSDKEGYWFHNVVSGQWMFIGEDAADAHHFVKSL